MNAPKLRDPFDLADELVRTMQEMDLADELVRTMQEMDREAVIDDGQETDPPEDDEAVTDYRNRRGE